MEKAKVMNLRKLIVITVLPISLSCAAQSIEERRKEAFPAFQRAEKCLSGYVELYFSTPNTSASDIAEGAVVNCNLEIHEIARIEKNFQEADAYVIVLEKTFYRGALTKVINLRFRSSLKSKK
jgi:hypothetical protein